MVPQLTCHLCGVAIKPGAHYVVRIDVFADAEMPIVDIDGLADADMAKQMQSLLDQMKGMTADELQDDVHRRFEYRLCHACQRRVLANPLGTPRLRREGEN
ncbi:MAG TPA: hypothetical protein VGN72_09395 [Tepidisphaeraceae bacterium]|jgi:hypothetical protein|nr:hypothetical protein [Tepidisphaeraceae bacterium]